MIQEVFITNSNNEVIFGDLRMFPQDVAYPITEVGTNRLCQLRVNDVTLSILYVALDNFTATKMLLDIKNLIENRIFDITAKSIKNNYFTVLELLQNVNSQLYNNKNDCIPGYKTEGFFIGVVETIHAIINKDGRVIKNSIFGNIVLNRGRANSLRAVIRKPEKFDLIYSSQYNLNEQLNTIEVSGKNVIENGILLSYMIHDMKTPMFELKRKGTCYTFVCGRKHNFKNVKITVPLPASAYHANLKTSAGTAVFDPQESVVSWNFEDFVFNSESISIEPRLLHEEKNKRPIKVEFEVQGSVESGISLENCGSTDGDNPEVWAHYSTQSGLYEIRI